MNLKEEKNKIRLEIKERLQHFTLEQVEENSKKISDFVLADRKYQEAKTIFCYIHMGKEVQTRIIIENALRVGKRVGVPLCIERGLMEVREITSYADLESGMYGILEPKKSTKRLAPKEIDYAIIPCVSCDLYKNRMGHGAGFYDRYLKQTQTFKVLLCFEEMMVEKIPTGRYDVPMDAIVTQRQYVL